MKKFALLGSITLLLVSTVSAQDMPLTQVLLPEEPWKLVAEGFKFTEGPAVDAEGNLYFTDIPNDRILRLVDGKVEVFVEGSHRTNGLMFGPDGKLYGCQNGLERIVAFDPKSGEAETIVDGAPSNDLVVLADGSLYFTDPGNSKVWYVDPQRKKRVVAAGIERPNGIIVWPDQQTLVVADSLGPYLWTYRIEKDGSLKFKEPYYELRTPHGTVRSGADGMTVDAAGRMYVATRTGLQVFDPTGRMSGVILKPHNAPLSNVVFAGPKLDTLYVTAGDKVFSRRTKATGVRFNQLPDLKK